jgi:hypothetical protein
VTAAAIRLLGDGFDFSLRLGEGAPTVTDGGANWEEVDRPERLSVTDYIGDKLTRISVPVLLDGYVDNRSVQGEVDAVRSLTRGDDSGGRPPSFTILGPIPYSGMRCVMEYPEEGEAMRTGDGVLVRQELTLKLVEFVDPDSIVVQTAGPASGSKAGAKKKKKKTITTGAGQTLISIAKKQPGTAKQIGQLNGIRDIRKKLPTGTVLRLPTSGK